MLRRLSLLAVVFCFGSAWLLCIARAGEFPKLDAAGPLPGDRYSNASNLACIGSFSPVFNTQIRIQVFHVLEDGELVQQSSFEFGPREDGKFAATLEPPGGNWLPGATRVRVTLSKLPQVKQEFDFEMTGPVGFPVLQALNEPKASDLILRLPLDVVKVYELPPRVFYFVEGTVPKVAGYKVEGPRLIANLLHIRDDGSRVHYDSRIGFTFLQPDGSYWFQLRMQSPEKPGLYHFKIEPIVKDALPADALGKSELPFSIRVVEPARPAKRD